MHVTHSWRLRGAATLLVAALLAAGCRDGTGPAPAPARIQLSEHALALDEGRSAALAATVLDDRGREIEGVPVQWSTSNASVVSVDASGLLRGESAGTGYVIASVAGGGAGLRDSAAVTVSAVPATIESGTWIPGTHAPGRTPEIGFRVLDRRGSPVPGVTVSFFVVRGTGTLTSPTAVTSSAGVAAVALELGTTGVDATIEARVDGVEQSGSFLARYLVGAGGLDPDSLALTPGCTQPIRLRIRDPGTGQELPGQTAEFTLADSSVASLAPDTAGSSSGVTRLVTGVKAGETRLVARWTAGALIDTAVVRVSAPVPTRVRFASGADTVGIGGRTGAAARITDQCGATLEDQPVTYRSLDPAVVEVGTPDTASGVVQVTGLKSGLGRVEAASGALRDTLRVEVLDVRLLPADTTVAVGATVTYRIVRVDASGDTVSVPVADLASPDTSVASVDSEAATVTALAPGTAEIRGETEDGVKVGTTLTVAAPPDP